MKVLKIIFLNLLLSVLRTQTQRIDERISKRFNHHKGSVTDLVVLPNGFLVSASEDNTLKLWNLDDEDYIQSFDTTSKVTSMIMHPNGSVVYGSEDSSIHILDWLKGYHVSELKLHEQRVTALAILQDGRLVSGSDDAKIVVWDTTNSQALLSINAHTSPVTSIVSMLHDDNLFASASQDRTIKIWDYSFKGLMQQIDTHSVVYSMLALPDGRIVGGLEDGSICIWNSESGQLWKKLNGHTDRVVSIVALSDGSIVSGSRDKTVKVWNISNGSFTSTSLGQNSAVTKLALLPSGDLAVSFTTKSIQIWSPPESYATRSIGSLTFSSQTIVILFNDNLASIDGNMIHVWSPDSETILKSFDAGAKVTCVLGLPNGNLASGSKDTSIKIWNMSQSAPVETIRLHSGAITQLVGLLGGSIASASEDKTIKVWDAEQPRLRLTNSLSGHKSTVTTLTVLKSGLLASGSLDKSIRIWDTETGKQVKSFAGLLHPVKLITELGNGQLAVVFDVPNKIGSSVSIFDPAEGLFGRVISGHFGPVTTMIVLPGGYLCTGSIDQTIKVWNTNTNALVDTFAGHMGSIKSLVVLRNGQLASSASDETFIWNLDLGIACEYYGILTSDNLRCTFGYNYESISIELSGKNLGSISMGTFDNYKRLRQLRMSQNSLRNLGSTVFSNLISLNLLDLFDNQLADIDPRIFASCGGLETLNLGSNGLTRLSSDFFKYLPQLTDLDLQENSISDLDVQMFEQVCLKSFNIRNNPIEDNLSIRFNGNCIQVYDRRKYRTLDQSTLTSLGYDEKVYVIEVNDKNINLIERHAFDGYENVLVLDLSYNAIEALQEDQFSSLTNLEELILTRNQLETLPKNLFVGLKNLTEIRLNKNYLTEIKADAFNGLENSIETIDLRDNMIQLIDENAFRNLTQLQRIYLRNNRVNSTDAVKLCASPCLVIV